MRLADEFNSGREEQRLSRAERAVRAERRPSAGGGPGFALNASRLATAESQCGRLILGASTIFSRGLVASRHADGLGTVVGLLAAGASRLAGFRAAAVVGLGEFVGGIVDHVVLLANGGPRFEGSQNFPEAR